MRWNEQLVQEICLNAAKICFNFFVEDKKNVDMQQNPYISIIHIIQIWIRFYIFQFNYLRRTILDTVYTAVLCGGKDFYNPKYSVYLSLFRTARVTCKSFIVKWSGNYLSSSADMWKQKVLNTF